MVLRRFSVLINLALVSLIVWVISDIFLTVVSSRLDIPPRAKVISKLKEPARAVKHPIEFYSVIAGKNIFNPSGKTNNKSQKEDVSSVLEERLSPTNLNLELKGTIIGDTKYSFAIILDKDKRKQDLYRLNDTIKGAELAKILADKVILIKDGREEILTMTYKKSSPARRPLEMKEHKAVKRVSSTKYILNRDAVNKTVGDLTQFMTQLNIKPYYVSGEPAGFQISKIKPGSLINKMGLRNGDIIKSINDMTIDSPEQAINVYQQLQSESSFKIKVERRGRKKTYQYEIK